MSGPDDEWEPHIARFERETRANPPPPGAALFYGSSSIAMWDDLPSYFPGIPCVQRGFGGSRTEHHFRYWRRVVLPCRPGWQRRLSVELPSWRCSRLTRGGWAGSPSPL